MPPLSLEVRRYRNEDRFEVKQLQRVAGCDPPLLPGESEEIPAGEAWVGQLRLHLVRAAAPVAWGPVVALAIARPLPDSVAEIVRVCVHPAHRRRGYARTLVTTLEESSRASGLRCLILSLPALAGCASTEALGRSLGYRFEPGGASGSDRYLKCLHQGI